MTRRELLDQAVQSGRPIHLVAGLGVDDLAELRTESLDAPLAALAWARLEPSARGSLEITGCSLSMRLQGEGLTRALERSSFTMESPIDRLRDLATRGPVVGHALETTLLARLTPAVRREIGPALIDLVDLAGDLGLGDAPGERTLAALLGRTPAAPPDVLERAEIFARLYQLPAIRREAAPYNALLIEEEGEPTELLIEPSMIAAAIGGTPEPLGLADGLVMISAAERLGTQVGSARLDTLLAALGGARELRPSGAVLISDRDDGARLRAAAPRIRAILRGPQGG